VHIVVLVKPVPDTAAGGERLGPDWRLDRQATPAVVNANDEYALEAALKLVATHGGDVTLVSMAPAAAPETMRKALAMGAQRGLLVTDEALPGACTLSTTRVLAAGLKNLEFDLLLAGADTSDGGTGVVPPGVATLLGLPFLSYAAKIEPDPDASTVRVHRIAANGFDVLEAPMPAMVVCTQALGEPRYPSLKGIMAARSRELTTQSLADIGVSPDQAGGQAATTTVVGSTAPPERPPTRVVRGPAVEAAREVVDFLVQRRIV